MAPVESPQTVSIVKLPILKKGECTLWSMRMEQYLTNTDYALWQTTQAILARQREIKAKSILLLAIPDEYQLRFYGIKDAKTLWDAIKNRFGGLDKAYDRFQKLISLLEVHGAAVSNEDENKKSFIALPSSWNNIALIMRNKDGIDELDIDDLYNNLKVFEADIKVSSGSSSNSQNVAFLSTKDISSSNEVNTANGVSTAAGHSSQGQAFSSSYVDDLMFSFFANQSSSPKQDDEDLEQIDHDNLEEMDLKWQVAMLSMRVKQFYKKTGRKLNFNSKEPVDLDKTKDRDNTIMTILMETSDAFVAHDNALVVQDGLGYDWIYIAQDEPTEFVLMAYTSISFGSDTEVLEARFSNEDANQKFLRALPSSWNNIALIMRNKDGIDDLDIDDLYNNLKVFEADIKGTSGSSSNSQNVAFLSTEDTSSINEVNTANGVSTAIGHSSQGQPSSSSYADDLMFSFFANQSNSPQLDEDLEKINHDDLEEMDLKWQAAMLSMRVKRFYKKTGRKLNFNSKQPAPRNQWEHEWEMPDGLGYDWIYIAQDEPTEFVLMAYTSISFGSDTEANLEIVAYQLGLESVEAQLIVHQKNESVYEEKIGVLEFEVKDKGNAITRLKNQLDETLREKYDLKAKIEHFETSSKNLNKLINSQLSAKDKAGLGYGDQLNENDSSGSELFNSHSSDGDDNQTNDRFKKVDGYHAVPPPLTGNYMPPLADLSFARLDDSVYRSAANKTSASMSKGKASISQTSNISVEKPRVKSVRSSEVLIEEWVSDDDDIFISTDLQTTDKPSFKKVEFTNARNEHVKPDKQAEKPRMVTQNPKVDRRDWNGKMTYKLGLGFAFTEKACFVCGSYNHLIKDCDFHEKRMAKKSILKDMVKGIGHREVRPVWNNAQRINHQNKFVASAVLTRFGRVPVSAAKRPFYKSTAPNTKISNEKVNAVRVNGVNTVGQIAISVVEGNGVTDVKASAGCVWRPKMTGLNNVSKDNSGSWISKRGSPQQVLKNKGIFDSGCSRHMTRNKDFLTDYQDIDGGFVSFSGGTKGGKITGKGKIKTDKLDFEDVFFVKELNFNIFSVLQMCDKKNNILFTKTECLVLSPDFKQLNESQVLLRVPRQSNMYSFDLRNVVPSGNLTCLFAKATIDESKLWHTRLGNVNFNTMNKLVKGNLAEAVNIACYVLNRVLVTKPHSKTPYELIIGRPPNISFMRPFRCPVTILNTLDPLGKFDGKAEKGFLVGYSVNSKAFRVFNTETRKVEENLHVNILENKPNVAGKGPKWLFDIDSLSNSMNYQPVTAGNQTNKNTGPQKTNGDIGLKENVDARQSKEENVYTQQYIMFLLWSSISSSYKSLDEKDGDDTADDAAGKKPVQKLVSENKQALKNVLDKMMDQEKEATEQSDAVRKEFKAQCNKQLLQGKATRASNTNSFNTVSTPVNVVSASRTFGDDGPSFVPIDVTNPPHDPLMPDLEDTTKVQNTSIFGNAYDDDDLYTNNYPYVDQFVGAEADFNNMEPSVIIIPIPTTRVHSIHLKNHIIRDPKSAVQIRGMIKKSSG
ncbi:ribonuclease H-like domain-containing protein [Tanacetum coccineum]